MADYIVTLFYLGSKTRHEFDTLDAAKLAFVGTALNVFDNGNDLEAVTLTCRGKIIGAVSETELRL